MMLFGYLCYGFALCMAIINGECSVYLKDILEEEDKWK